MTASRARGMTRSEAIVSIFCGVAVLALASAGAPQDGGPASPLHPKSLHDATKLGQISQAMVIFSRDADGVLPRPGLINRIGNQPGIGAEDITQNTTANLYSALIAQRYVAPDLVISPVERNPNVSEKDDYDYDAYAPVNDVYWDTSFDADLAEGSHVSYAHMPIVGKRAREHWRDAMEPEWVLLSNRGPEGGKANPSSHTCGPHGLWAGNVVFADNHVKLLRNPSIGGDNLFEDAGDMFSTFTKTISAEGEAAFQWD